MIQWKQRLYAFLLRRLLGPFLGDSSATKQLHDSIDFSLQEGRFTLKDITLNAHHLNSIVAASSSAGFAIRRARIGNLGISLELSENVGKTHHGDDPHSSTSRSSLAWRAVKLGTGTGAMPAVSLIAQVDVRDIFLELEPSTAKCREQCSKPQSPTTHDPQSDDTKSSQSAIRSYIDSALSSLQLTLKMSNINVKICSSRSPSASPAAVSWIDIRLSSACYRDMEASTEKNTTNYKTVLNKTLEFSGLKIQAGESYNEAPTAGMNLPDISHEKTRNMSTVVLAQGTAQVFIRAVEYGPSKSQISENTIDADHKGLLQQDIEIRMNQQLNISVDRLAINQIRAVVDGISRVPEGEEEQLLLSRETSDVLDRFSVDSSSDEDDLLALSGILKQYQEAYHLAERNELRGGILIPSNAFEDDVDLDEEQAVTFDAFFDANDQSFYHYASVLKESLVVSTDTERSDDFVHTKMRFFLLGGCIKVVFSDSKRMPSIRRLEEYLLITFDDWSMSSSLSRCMSDLSLSVSHLGVEDAQVDKSYSGEAFISYGGQPLAEGRLDIGNFVQFSMLTVDEAGSVEDEMVAPAPSLTFHLTSKKDADSSTSLHCDLALSPLELLYRHKTVSNLVKLMEELGTSVDDLDSDVKTMTLRKRDPVHEMSNAFSFCGSCSSITVLVPLLQHVNTDKFHRRCGEVLHNESIRESTIGIHWDEISMEYSRGHTKNQEVNAVQVAEARLTCQHIVASVTSPIGGHTTADTQMQRTDFAVANGRMEVNPYIPISISLVFNAAKDPERNHGRDSFPVVPTISSFKARQEDEDEELKIDRVLFSKLKEVAADSRKELRGTNSQGTMLSNAEKCSLVATISIPELTVDLTKTELDVLLEMANASIPGEATDDASKVTVPVKSKESVDALCIAFSCDRFSLFLHNDTLLDQQIHGRKKSDSEMDSCIFVIDRFKAHSVVEGSQPQHVRLLCHEPCLYEGRSDFEKRSRPSLRHGEKGRFSFVCERGYCSLTSASPICYRSRLFAPISRDSPSILFDFVDQTRKCAAHASTFGQQKVHLTLYHLTYRYDVTTSCIDRLSAIFARTNAPSANKDNTKPQSNEAAPSAASESQTSLTRLFLSIADCSVDYSSAPFFKTASRTILRVGDLRVSSNLVTPLIRVQAYSMSLGDIAVHVVNYRYPYQAENCMLCRASKVLNLSASAVRSRDKVVSVSNSETLLREMGFVNVFALDSMDSIVAVATGKENESKDPQLRVSITVGLVSVQACKDSFECFSTTVSELQAKLTALADSDVAKLKAQSEAIPFKDDAYIGALDTRDHSPCNKNEIQTLGPLIDTKLLWSSPDSPKPFLLDGYDWTTVDHDSLHEPEIPEDDDQVAMWYGETETEKGVERAEYSGRIIQQHFPIHTVSDPLGEGDMDAAEFAGTPAAPLVRSRILVHELKFKLRLFDGYDWPGTLAPQKKWTAGRDDSSFVIGEPPSSGSDSTGATESKDATEAATTSQNRKSKLLYDLLGDSDESPQAFGDIPLPEDRGVMLERQAILRRLSRRTHRFLQISVDGVSLRMDSFVESSSHRLLSIMDLSVHDLFLAETLSRPSPLKMIGEWVNDKDHPRDTKDGTLMLKMVTWKPVSRVTADNQIANDECEVTMKLLPMRCIVDQRAIGFIRVFFGSDSDKSNDSKESWTTGLHLVPPPKFRVFRVKPWKLKVDYCPKEIDIAALRDGSFVELINLSPIDSMVITLQQVTVENVIGMGEVFGGLFGNWISEICSTQLHKFLTNARPFEPFANVSSGVADLVVLPYEAFRNGEDVRRAMRSGITSLAGIVAFETLTTTSRLTQYAANKMAAAIAGTPLQRTSIAANPLPSRPLDTPKGVSDVAGHAIESLARGVQAANYKVVVVPYREYSRSGATGAAKSVLKGIPVLVVAPLTGATEAISYTLLGARNALRPDIRKEEEATVRGLHYEL